MSGDNAINSADATGVGQVPTRGRLHHNGKKLVRDHGVHAETGKAHVTKPKSFDAELGVVEDRAKADEPKIKSGKSEDKDNAGTARAPAKLDPNAAPGFSAKPHGVDLFTIEPAVAAVHVPVTPANDKREPDAKGQARAEPTPESSVVLRNPAGRALPLQSAAVLVAAQLNRDPPVAAQHDATVSTPRDETAAAPVIAEKPVKPMQGIAVAGDPERHAALPATATIQSVATYRVPAQELARVSERTAWHMTVLSAEHPAARHSITDGIAPGPASHNAPPEFTVGSQAKLKDDVLPGQDNGSGHQQAAQDGRREGKATSEPAPAHTVTLSAPGDVSIVNDEAAQPPPAIVRQAHDGVLKALDHIERIEPSAGEQPSVPRFVRNLEIVLDPPEHGRLEVNLSLNSNALDVRISASNEATAGLLSSDRGSLENKLSEQGLELTSYAVSVAPADSANNQAPGSDGRPDSGQRAGGSFSNGASGQAQDHAHGGRGHGGDRDGAPQHQQGMRNQQGEKRGNGTEGSVYV